jgi:hypothetical protein
MSPSPPIGSPYPRNRPQRATGPDPKPRPRPASPEPERKTVTGSTGHHVLTAQPHTAAEGSIAAAEAVAARIESVATVEGKIRAG